MIPSLAVLPEFKPFGKIPRLFRTVMVTEKIDGTNACVYVPEVESSPVLAGSRNRWLSVGEDNFGFAKWVDENSAALRELGPGLHYGEWWGLGIQRGYGLKEKRFSLFNVDRWTREIPPRCCGVVPILYQGEFTPYCVLDALEELREVGSIASPGFRPPEGVCIYHCAAGQYFKATLENDSQPKGAVE